MELVLGAGPVVKLVLLVLVYFSVVSWAIIFLNFRTIHRATGDSERFLDFFWAKKRFDAIFHGLKDYANSPLTVLFRDGYQELLKGQRRNDGDEEGGFSADLGTSENVSRALRRATTLEIHRLEKFLTFLATTGSTAPFIGLFGTVWGIMYAFHGIGKTGSASLAVVARVSPRPWWQPPSAWSRRSRRSWATTTSSTRSTSSPARWTTSARSSSTSSSAWHGGADGGRRGRRRRRTLSQINVTPMVDVMLVLLIIFMVTAPMMDRGSRSTCRNAERPGAGNRQGAADGDRRPQRRPSRWAIPGSTHRPKLTPVLRQVLSGHRDRQVLLEADLDVPYGRVVQVMAAIRGAGVEKLGMVSQPPQR